MLSSNVANAKPQSWKCSWKIKRDKSGFSLLSYVSLYHFITIIGRSWHLLAIKWEENLYRSFWTTLGAPVTLERPTNLMLHSAGIESSQQKIPKWYRWDWYIYLHLLQNQPNVGKFKYTWMVWVCSAGVTIVQWLMEFKCVDFSEAIMRWQDKVFALGTSGSFEWCTWKIMEESWNEKLVGLSVWRIISPVSTFFTVKVGRFCVLSIPFGSEVTGHYKIHPNMIRVCVCVYPATICVFISCHQA